MSLSKPSKGNYFIIYEDNMYKIDPSLFLKMSTKFSEDLAQFPNQMVFKENVSNETFKVFLSACQLRPFNIEKHFALEVLEIARKWGISTLEQFTIEFCDENGIKYHPRVDHLGKLIENVENNSESFEDIQNVAQAFDDVIKDDRIVDLEPEILFRVVVEAEKNGFNRDLYTNFVMELFHTHPETAVLLSLRLDFDSLTEDQIDTIFRCAEMHSISIGFFVAFSLSAVRNNTKRKLFDSERHHIEVMDLFQREMDYDKRHLVSDLDEEHHDTMTDLMDKLMKQHEKIEELTDILTQQAECLDKGSLSSKGIGDENLRKIKDDIDNQLVVYKDRVDIQIQDTLENCFKSIASDVKAIREEREAEVADPTKVREETARLVQLGESKSDLVEKETIIIEDGIEEFKGAMAYKIMKDHMRFNKGMRTSGEKFSVFDEEPEIWGLSSNKVKAQSRMIKELEKRLDVMCPIRGGAIDKGSSSRKGSNVPSLLEDII